MHFQGIENRHFKWRTVLGAFALQLGLGGVRAEGVLGSSFARVHDRRRESIALLWRCRHRLFVWRTDVAESVGFSFALKVLPIIVFFAALIAVLYHVGIMKWIIRIIGGALQRVLGTSRAESMSATANIFVGQTEAPSRRQAIHRNHDPVGVVCRHGRRTWPLWRALRSRATR